MLNNPIIQGFYPDPSIVRVDKDFYLVTSSFSYFPGVPIFHSTDLAHWEQIGHVLDRKSQLPLTYEMMSMGIFAPTIRYHKGVFYVITTNASMQGKNFIVTATDPKGPWSEPYVIEGAVGIDPSLFFDDDGKAYYTGSAGFGEEPGIWISEIDLEQMKLVGERKFIWHGALINAPSPEAPHIYKRNGWYYLIIAEGGTEKYHAVTVSRCREIMGDYVGFEGNPILTHRHLGAKYPICNVGHGDLVELEDGSWYMVCLGSRLLSGSHKILGRETFIAPVTWEEDWPIVSCGSGKIEESYPMPAGIPEIETDNILYHSRDEFESDKLDFQWNCLGTPYEDFIKVEESCLKLKLLKKQVTPWEFHDTLADLIETYKMVGQTKECVSFLGRRQQHRAFAATTKMIFRPEEAEKVGIVVLQHGANQLRMEYGLDEHGVPVIAVMKTMPYEADGRRYFKEECLGKVKINAGEQDALYLKVAGKEAYYSFYVGTEEGQWTEVALDVDGGFLGSETAGGMVGAYIGMFASGVTETKEKYVAFDWFEYQELQ